jgi:glutamyl-tRNA reductase
MTILTLGLNHKTAPVDIRERLSFGPDIIVGALRTLMEQTPITEAAILSTCNRTELYCAGEDGDCEAEIRDWLGRFHGVEPQLFAPHLYLYRDRESVRHLLRVASGLDSMVLGEPQILGQVKLAFQTACDSGSTGRMLGRLFQHCFSVAKQVRTDTAIGSSPVSVAFAAVSLARQIFSELSQQTALLIGAGETIELAARHLHQHGVGRIIVANRTVERAHKVAAQFDGYAIALTELANHLPEADIVVSSTASPVPVLGKGVVERATARCSWWTSPCRAISSRRSASSPTSICTRSTTCRASSTRACARAGRHPSRRWRSSTCTPKTSWPGSGRSMPSR